MGGTLLCDGRARLRPIEATDLEPLGLGRSPRLLAPCPALGPAGTDGRLEGLLRASDAGRAFAVGAPGEGRTVGAAALLNLDWKNRHAALAWLAADPDAEGTVRAALELLAAFAFDELGLERLEAETFEADGAGVLAALGFRREALKRDAARRDSRRCDVTVWGLLRDERAGVRVSGAARECE